MPGVEVIDNTIGQPEWMADFGSRDHLEVFPAKVSPLAFNDALAVVVKANGAVSGGVDEVQTLTIDAGGGTFTLSFGAQVTGNIAWNATAAAVEAALEALSTIPENGVEVTGSAGGPYTITFRGTLGKQNVAAIVTDPALLTGGAGTAVIATTTPGAAPATTMAVDALSGTIPYGAILQFPNGVFATVGVAAVTGATSITIANLTGNIADNAEARVSPALGRVYIRSGTLLGRTYAERDNSDALGPAVHTDDEFFILAFDITDAVRDPGCTLYRRGSTVKENFLPEWATIENDANLLTKLRATYKCIKGAA